MMKTVRIESDIHFNRVERGARRNLQPGVDPTPEPLVGRTPRITRLMALAIWFEKLIADGDVADYAELARLGQVSRARVTQIMNLLLLAPDIQTEILFLPRVTGRWDPICLRHLQMVALVPTWGKQRTLWHDLQKRVAESKA